MPPTLPAKAKKPTTTISFAGFTTPASAPAPTVRYEKKDIGPEDYAKKGLPYVFDLQHSQCPNDGHELQVQNMTVMPSLRLSVGRRAGHRQLSDHAERAAILRPTPMPSYMDDPKLKAEGKKWIRHFGCAGCHEIAGLEDEGRIGTDLTVEGSKPIERLDFALYTDPRARRQGAEPINDPEDLARLPEGPAKAPWYDHKGFFEHKLAEPNVYDQGMIKSETEKLRMPNLHLTKEQVQALTTFLLGSEETSLPDSYQYKPEDAPRDIQDGWWIVQEVQLHGLPPVHPGPEDRADGTCNTTRTIQEQLPPKLLTEGARVDPEWLRQFLANPALSATDTNRNGVRPYLNVRMPTFYFSDNEVRKLVRFFQALSQQPMPYIPEQVPVLTAKETDMARSLFSSTAAPCLKCHATGDPQHDQHRHRAQLPAGQGAPQARTGWSAGS